MQALLLLHERIPTSFKGFLLHTEILQLPKKPQEQTELQAQLSEAADGSAWQQSFAQMLPLPSTIGGNGIKEEEKDEAFRRTNKREGLVPTL